MLSDRQRPPPPTAETLKPYVPRLLDRLAEGDARRAAPGGRRVARLRRHLRASPRSPSGWHARGRSAPELMRDTLDGVFTALLDEAYDWGAGLLKWGGDALLLLFDGPGHAAARRARVLGDAADDRAGRAAPGPWRHGTLRMSIGITTGRLDFFIAGQRAPRTSRSPARRHRDGHDRGDRRCRRDRHQPRACRPARPVVRRTVQGGALLLVRSTGYRAANARRTSAPSTGSTSPRVSRSQRARTSCSSGASPSIERSPRRSSTSWTPTSCSSVSGPRRSPTALDERISVDPGGGARFEVPFYETDVGKSSVKALLTAGAPSSTGHDEERMLRALREIMDRPGRDPDAHRRQHRQGVHGRLRAAVSSRLPRLRRRHQHRGTRDEPRPTPGRSSSTAIVLERSRTTFATTPIEPFRAKGKANLVHASIVGPITGMRGGRRAETPLIGRDAELGALLEVVRDVRNGQRLDRRDQRRAGPWPVASRRGADRPER